ncbi:hypothetical protein E1301_Tti019927 [Triplophysa tibetana]|uniref:Uncharacterized protein n=1 Tax=Triplophysa tibetana TaxID=1572043 RepID=A0A5A9PSQ8_9TELE|nr:hypothetical protein E1301_Tti019927 [Triplophysa tibetana]
MDEVLLSATVVFCSPCSGDNVAKHYNNLLVLMQQLGTLDVDEQNITAEDYKNDVGTTPLESHFQQVIERAPLDHDGEENNYHAPTFIARLAKHFLPHATLWSGLMLGDIGRHGTGSAYQHFSKIYKEVSQSNKQAERKGDSADQMYVEPKTPERTEEKRKAERKDDSAYQMYVEPKTPEKTEEKRKKALVKNIRRRRSKIEGPIWNESCPVEITAPRRLSRPPKINMLQQILHQDYWLTCDTIDLASYLMAKDNMDIDGFQSVLPFSAIARGGIVGTPKEKFVQILNIRQNLWITMQSSMHTTQPVQK